ncbi:glycosyltransferase family 2 protein [Natronoflexus pectinivorans]|uniref:GT2 family glycosyltransferase n=1 Tax=Natronoflexus pectinivorans TaxID=682526 RepID=A0A4R2GFP0_9BACT|nr:glycosyltransferase family A protein [Natronoflexus pectinivorans]TCO06853.1 GT2 family glycosyltransferase [Natronoflexus pectinivorans]
MPTVSVIVTTYNRPNYLKEALDSVFKQTYRDFEVIVIDDGTPGVENEQICDAYSDIKYHKISNSGSPIVPRNTGISMAKGKYIAFLDDDDIWLPEKLEVQVEILDNNPDFGLVHGYCAVIDSKGNKTGEIEGRLKNPFLKHGYVFDRMVGNFTVMMSTPLIRREVLEKTGGFDVNIPAAGEDMEFYTRLAFYTQFWFLDQPLVLYRVHEAGISVNNYNYNHLPVVLYRTVKNLKQKEGLEARRFRLIVRRLLLQQLAMANSNRTFRTAFLNSFKISPLFWIHPIVIWGLVLRLPNLFKFK